jgi:hypothetical protein
MRRSNFIRLSENDLRNLVHRLMLEVRIVQDKKEQGSITVETNLGFEHKQALQDHMEERIKDIIDFEMAPDETEDSLNFKIVEGPNKLLYVELYAESLEGLDALQAQVENYEDDEVFEKESTRLKAAELLQKDYTFQAPAWGSALPSSYHGKN